MLTLANLLAVAALLQSRQESMTNAQRIEIASRRCSCTRILDIPKRYLRHMFSQMYISSSKSLTLIVHKNPKDHTGGGRGLDSLLILEQTRITGRY